MADRTVTPATTLRGWRKSSYSGPEGGSCLEVIDRHDWRKSSHSNSEGGSCLEVLDSYPAGVPVRDSKNPHGPALLFPAAGWSSFVTAVKSGKLPV
ncbi:hypothetical protein QF026_005555 [Streptomyces aurantiacus]|uniref:DUF397 domain-containing protein n=1 Tax=Streptomyces aurantiacus TaxID=47760 RepID=UPI002792DC2C|nr:DUF397 domain-containing protein [Streptomyces aurantiacus]MDQ0777089.1 hypothetical protein [Streptomyces aurantiacus]